MVLVKEVFSVRKHIKLLSANPLRYSSVKSFRGLGVPSGEIRRKGRDKGDFNKQTTTHRSKINM